MDEHAPKRVSLPGPVELPYVEQGDPGGATVVFLHAYADSWRSFGLVLGHLPRSVHALAPTQRGHGEASKPASGYRVEDFAGDLAAFLDALGIARAVLVASSSASFTVQRLAVDRPDRATGLVLIGAPWSLREKRPSLEFLDAVGALEDPVDPTFVREFVESTSSTRVPRGFLETMVAESLQVPARAWKGTLAGLIEAVPPAETASVAAPTLIVWGDRDELARREDQERLLAAIPGSRLLVYEGVGHIVHWEEPDRVARDVAAFAHEVVG
jgi:non-heme chloroperoxidase